MIGVFDSGFGGLSVFRELHRVFPEHDFLYLGDNARAPYGDRSADAVYRFTKQAVSWLFSQGCELVILACNTASAQALRRMQQEWLPRQFPDRRVLGVLAPVVEEAARKIRTQDTVGVIATRGTVASGSYPRELSKYLSHETRIIQQACPLFVPLVEEGLLDHTLSHAIAAHYLTSLREEAVSLLILGCTHYPFLAGVIKEYMGPSCVLLSADTVVPKALSAYLMRRKELDASLGKNGLRRYVTTDSPERFNEFAKTIAGLSVSCERLALHQLERLA